jgi:hypothetical protein
MTPKEKAEELVNEFRKYASGDDDDYRFSPAIEKENAKLCAVLSVGEMLEEIKDSADKEIVVPRIIYWEKVKQEIEKL